ncbi:MAG TPA: hypothetical protein VJ953_11330 [Saprospiraceae bacterium]|nr:hypothetical protein [Saprospiraceae bacterium]
MKLSKVFLLGISNFTFAQSGTASMNKTAETWEVGGILALNSFAGDLVEPNANDCCGVFSLMVAKRLMDNH